MDKLSCAMRREVQLQRMSCEKIWNMRLLDRVSEGHSLGPLEVVSVKHDLVLLRPANRLAEVAECALREGAFVSLSQDTPFAPTGHFIHLGEDGDGIRLLRWQGDMPVAGDGGWVMDPDFYDMSPRFLEAIDALASTELGRDRILPIVMGEADALLDAVVHDEVMDALEGGNWHDSQQVAIAACIAARDSYLVQGPPGTGKTRVLAEVARRLVERGERVLVTGPTHRAIDQALESVCAVIGGDVRVVKVGFAWSTGGRFECYESYAETGLLDSGEAHVVGATPFALWGKFSGMREAHFDSVLLDEASQLTPLLAVMAMLRGERWLFFGDDCQLPPVVLADDGMPPRLRSVFGRLKNRGFDTMLELSWRLNAGHAEWPSATFYGNRLQCQHDGYLALSPMPELVALRARPAVSLVECNEDVVSSVRSDAEAQLVVELVRQAVAGGMPAERIGVITLFRAQAARIRRVLGMGDGGVGLRRRVLVDTVDRYQGQERDLIVVSLAANEDGFIRRRADFLFQPERLNVAVTRARLKTVFVFSSGLLFTASKLADDGHDGASCFASLARHLQGEDH